jgi:hypothetical protein
MVSDNKQVFMCCSLLPQNEFQEGGVVDLKDCLPVGTNELVPEVI